jgi:hypothetical protein
MADIFRPSEPTLALTRSRDVRRWYVDYAEAERAADLYKGDTRTPEGVYVIEHLLFRTFTIVVGINDLPSGIYGDLYEIQYIA